MPKSKKIRLIFIIYWFLLAYIIAALIWWYIALSLQNDQMAELKMINIKHNEAGREIYKKIAAEKKRKTAQYIGEGSIFLLLISAGAVFVYRAVNRQLKFSLQQQNFMMAITHELKTPIAITKLNLETLQKRKLDDAQQQRLLQNTLQEANRLNTLCNNILLSSQIEAGGYNMTNEEISMKDVVQNCINDFEIRFPQREIISDLAEDSFVTADIFLIQMAVNNLLDNALKYSGRESPVLVKLFKKNTDVVLQVIDEGPGIDDMEKKKIFKKFYRVGNEATRRAKGTGLGLYLTDKIITAHHGKIFLNNNQPCGTIFIMQLKHSL